MNPRTRAAISHDGDFELTDAEKRKNAQRLARSAIVSACRDSVVAKQLDALEGVPVTTLSQEVYKAALLLLLDISANASRSKVDPETGEAEESADYRARNDALRTIADMRMREAELLVELQKIQPAQAPTGGLPGLASGEAVVLTPEEVAALEAAQREEQGA